MAKFEKSNKIASLKVLFCLGGQPAGLQNSETLYSVWTKKAEILKVEFPSSRQIVQLYILTCRRLKSETL